MMTQSTLLSDSYTRINTLHTSVFNSVQDMHSHRSSVLLLIFLPRMMVFSSLDLISTIHLLPLQFTFSACIHTITKHI